MIDVFRSKLLIWKVKHLSMGSRLTLIKSVLSSIPIYSLLVRLLPVTVRNSLRGIMSRFLWGKGSKERRKMHLVDWDTVTHPCSKDNLGIPNLEVMNLVLLVKWIYRYGNEGDML